MRGLSSQGSHPAADQEGLDLDWERLTCFLLMLADGQSSDLTHIWGYWVLSEDGDWGPYLCTLPLPYSSQQAPSFSLLFPSFFYFFMLLCGHSIPLHRLVSNAITLNAQVAI